MKLKCTNVVKGWITSLAGIATVVITLISVFKGSMDFIWNGVAGIAVGTTLLLAPRTIEKAFLKLISKFTGSSDSKPEFDEFDIYNDKKPE